MKLSHRIINWIWICKIEAEQNRKLLYLFTILWMKLLCCVLFQFLIKKCISQNSSAKDFLFPFAVNFSVVQQKKKRKTTMIVNWTPPPRLKKWKTRNSIKWLWITRSMNNNNWQSTRRKSSCRELELNVGQSKLCQFFIFVNNHFLFLFTCIELDWI